LAVAVVVCMVSKRMAQMKAYATTFWSTTAQVTSCCRK